MQKKLIFGCIVLIACIIPIFLIAITVHYLPICDAWDDTIVLYFKYIHHSLTLSDWLAPHNEHRLLLVRLIFFTKYLVWPASRYFVALVSYLLLVATYMLLIQCYKRSQYLLNQTTTIHPIIYLLFACFVFSPKDISYWSWSYIIQFPLTLFFVTAAIFTLSNNSINGSRLLLGIAMSLLATLSSANGLSIWPLGCLLLLFYRVDAKKIAIYAVMGVITILLYSHNNYLTEFVINQPVRSLAYMLIFLGASNMSSVVLALVAGIILLSLFAYALKLLLNNTTTRQREILYPWLALGVFTFANVIVGAFTRIQLGVAEGLAYRYIAIEITLCVSVIAFYGLTWKTLNKQHQKIISVFAFVAMLAFVINMSNIFHKLTRHYFYSNQEIALPYNVLLPDDKSAYLFGNDKIATRLFEYKHSPLYNLIKPTPNYLNTTLSETQQLNLGQIISTQDYSLKTPTNKDKMIYSGFASGIGITGKIALQDTTQNLSPSILLLNKENRVIGIGFIAKPFFNFSKSYRVNFFGFITSNTTVSTLLRLSKPFAVKQKLTHDI